VFEMRDGEALWVKNPKVRRGNDIDSWCVIERQEIDGAACFKRLEQDQFANRFANKWCNNQPATTTKNTDQWSLSD